MYLSVCTYPFTYAQLTDIRTYKYAYWLVMNCQLATTIILLEEKGASELLETDSNLTHNGTLYTHSDSDSRSGTKNGSDGLCSQ